MRFCNPQGSFCQRGRIRVIVRVQPDRVFLAPEPGELPLGIPARLPLDGFHRFVERAAPLKVREQLLVADGLHRSAAAYAVLPEIALRLIQKAGLQHGVDAGVDARVQLFAVVAREA